jgi:hypothetical protein
MRFRIMCLAIAAGVLMADQSSLHIRGVIYKVVSTSKTPLKQVSIPAITTMLKSKGITLENFDSAEVDRAADVVRDLYGNMGQKVRVEHSVTQASAPRSVEVEFTVIQLCSCE